MTVATATAISLDVACCDTTYTRDLLSQLALGNYGECSVLPIPSSLDEWRGEHRTARKRASCARGSGYQARHVLRHERADEIMAINLSLETRQGRPMSAGYRERPSETVDRWDCRMHSVQPYGVFTRDDVLVAYLWMYRAGELALVSQILGHGSHLKSGVMYLLMEFAIGAEIAAGPGFLVYNRHDSGTDGLRFFKERIGFEETRVEWLP